MSYIRFCLSCALKRHVGKPALTPPLQTVVEGGKEQQQEQGGMILTEVPREQWDEEENNKDVQVSEEGGCVISYLMLMLVRALLKVPFLLI